MTDIARKMADAILHRGPDDAGTWVDAESGVAFGHRRLSIIDLSTEGHQPMLSACGRYVIVYNGEIYNFQEIRAELLKTPATSHQPPTFRGHSDTEVLLAAISAWGIEQTLSRANGMFAFALWDQWHKTLILARDRFGKKPMYFGWVDGAFVFGSEMKALKAHPGFSNEVDRQSLCLYLRHNCIPAPYSIYQRIYKLPGGSFCKLRLEQVRGATCYDDIRGFIERYWSPEQVGASALEEMSSDSEGVITKRLDTLLLDAVAGRMIADVPLGAFLSGGIDSSLVVALMQAQSSRPVQTFTVGFHEASHNEAEDARNVAQHLRTDHHELYLSPRDVLDVVPKLPKIYDEPFADSSQVPTFLIAKFAREQVTVALSGDGGDELFGGYNRYVWAPKVWEKMAAWPLLLRGCASVLLENVPPHAWPKLMSLFGKDFRTPADKVHKLAEVLRVVSPAQIYETLISHWERPTEIVIDSKEPATLVTYAPRIIEHFGFSAGMMVLDQETYLPDDILTKVDRASMAVSLEVRAPLLDYRLAEFAARIPQKNKIRNGQGKYLLRKVLEQYVPRTLFERPKAGFEVPIDKWLRGPLRDWAENLLGHSRLTNDGFFYPGLIRKRWEEHLTGKRNWQFHLWDILMFNAWLNNQRG